MENKKSIDNLRNDSVNGEEIKGGGDPTTVIGAAPLPGMDPGMDPTLGIDPVLGDPGLDVAMNNMMHDPAGNMPNPSGPGIAINNPQPGDI